MVVLAIAASAAYLFRTPLSLALARVTGDGRSRRQTEALAESIRTALDATDAVVVLGSNRVGVVSIDRPPAALAALLDEAAVRSEGVVAWVAAEIAGSEPIADALATLERALVGAAAPARAASQTLVYDFCPSCGLKGHYRRLESDQARCKYCRRITTS